MNLPSDFIERMRNIPDFDIESFLHSYNFPPLAGIRINPMKEKADYLFEKEFGIKEKTPWCEYGYYVNKEDIKGTHPYHLAGMFYFQEPSAMCVAEMLPLEDGDFVLDLCAAPGGKSTQLAARNRNITLVSNEIIPKRARVLSENVERLGFSNVIVTNESPEQLENHFQRFFDKIVIDAPCSGEGMFKKEPAAIEAWSTEHVSACATRQRKIIDSALKMLKQGGAIVYSTCTFSEEENEANVDYIINNYPWMELVKMTKLYPHTCKGEGHFAALLRDSRCKNLVKNNSINSSKIKKEIDLFKKFEDEFLNTNLNGEFVLFGENIYLKPNGVNIDGIKVVRPGLHLGVCKKGRFEPSHALAKALRASDIKNTLNFSLNDNNLYKYLKGETLEGDFTGYGVITCDCLPVGWFKGSEGILKNKFPKGLRMF